MLQTTVLFVNRKSKSHLASEERRCSFEINCHSEEGVPQKVHSADGFGKSENFAFLKKLGTPWKCWAQEPFKYIAESIISSQSWL